MVGGSGLCCPHLCPKSLVFPMKGGKEATEGKQTLVIRKRAPSLLWISGNEMGGKHWVV